MLKLHFYNHKTLSHLKKQSFYHCCKCCLCKAYSPDTFQTHLVKLGLMKQFVTALNTDGACFRYLCSAFPGMSMEKIKAGIFNGTQIRQLIKDLQFARHMTEHESAAWTTFVLIIKNFLGNYKASNYVELVTNMLSSFKDLGCNMSIKVHYLHSHLDHFSKNLGDLSEEHGERFHQDIRVMEERYQGR